jgi:hypothetical protein
MSRSLPGIEQSIAFGTVGASFVDLGTPTLQAYNKFWIQNLTDKTLQFSWDGADNVNLTLPSNSGFVSDEGTNAPNDHSKPSLMAKGTQMRIKYPSAAPTSGTANFNGEYTV